MAYDNQELFLHRTLLERCAEDLEMVGGGNVLAEQPAALASIAGSASDIVNAILAALPLADVSVVTFTMGVGGPPAAGLLIGFANTLSATTDANGQIELPVGLPAVQIDAEGVAEATFPGVADTNPITFALTPTS